MQDTTPARLDITPFFDLELLMSISQEKRLGGAALDRLVALWQEWLPHLTVQTLHAGKIQYLVVWLSQQVEDAVDKAWADSPSQAYLDNALAQTLCMSAIHSILPEIEDAGCAPAPRPTENLRTALAEIGLPYKDTGPALTRRYAVLTHYPFKGGCEICCLQDMCPKGQGGGTGCGQGGAASVVLPGYEQA